MPRRNQDSRVRSTRDAIVASFNRLVLRRGYGATNVPEIAGEAGVARSTFYEHFQNKDALLRRSALHVLAPLAEATGPTGEAAAITGTLEHIRDNRRMAREMMTGDAGEQLVLALADLVERQLAGTNFAIPVRLVAMQIARSQLGLIRAWIDALEPCPASALASVLLAQTPASVEAARWQG
ncbi:MAG: helix-turn-helix domain-containing protein [Planctomycetota bacterium]